jgi:hypothetical protein
LCCFKQCTGCLYDRSHSTSKFPGYLLEAVVCAPVLNMCHKLTNTEIQTAVAGTGPHAGSPTLTQPTHHQINARSRRYGTSQWLGCQSKSQQCALQDQQATGCCRCCCSPSK